MGNIRRISKKYYVRQIVACMLVYFMLLGMPVQVALAVGTLNAESVIGSVGAKSGILDKWPSKKHLSQIKVRILS